MIKEQLSMILQLLIQLEDHYFHYDSNHPEQYEKLLLAIVDKIEMRLMRGYWG